MISKEVILGVLRHGLTFAGGFLVAKGVLSADELGQFVDLVVGSGAGVGLIGLVWSVIAKRNQPAA